MNLKDRHGNVVGWGMDLALAEDAMEEGDLERFKRVISWLEAEQISAIRDRPNITQETLLHDVAQHPDPNFLKAALEHSGALDLEVRNGKERTPLLHAARETGQSEQLTDNITLLLNAESDVNARDHNGMNALMLLMRDSFLISPSEIADMTHAMLAKGIDVHCAAEGGGTALMYAASHGNLEAAQILAQKGGLRLIDAQNNDGTRICRDRRVRGHRLDAGERAAAIR